MSPKSSTTAPSSNRASLAFLIAIPLKTLWKKGATLKKWSFPAPFVGTLKTEFSSTKTKPSSSSSLGTRNTSREHAADVEAALRLLEGRSKLVILFHLFGGKVMRFSELERAIPSTNQKTLAQKLRSLAVDGIVVRTSYPQVPPKVEYRLTAWGQSLCPTLDAILKWADRRPADRRKRNSR